MDCHFYTATMAFYRFIWRSAFPLGDDADPKQYIDGLLYREILDNTAIGMSSFIHI